MNRARAAIAWLTTWRHLSLIAIIPITAHAHWHLAVQLGYPHWLAPLLPVALDAYVLAAFRAWTEQANRGPARVKVVDLFWALTLDMAAVAGSHAAGQYKLTDDALTPVRAGLAALLGVILVLTLWRVHALDVRAKPQVKAGAKPRQGSEAHAVTPEPLAPEVDPAETLAPEVPDPPVLAPATPDPDPVLTPAAGTTIADVKGPVDLDRWVALQVQARASRGETLLVGARKFGVSQTTVKRRWLHAKAAEKAADDSPPSAAAE